MEWFDEDLMPIVVKRYLSYHCNHNKTIEHMDNVRWCYVGDKDGEVQYKDKKDHGCCGSVDEIVYDGPRMVKVGFNYGH